MNSLVTIIVPIYKVEEYLSQCIDSIINQTYKNLEIILVDDGSPDNCGKICDDYALKDSRIKVIHKPNGGLSDARNVAIDIAKGEWITFIDSDDYIPHDYIEYLYDIVSHDNCQCSVVQVLSFKEGAELPNNGKDNSFVLMDGIEAVSALFYQTKLDTCAPNKLYHKSLFDTGIRYPKGYLFEDNPTTFRLIALCEKVAVSQRKYYYYRLREGSIERQDFTPEKLNQGLKILRMMDSYPEITNKVPNSFKCKKTSLALHFIMKMPSDYIRKEELWEYVKQNRWKVIWDNKARLKTRIGCLLSYLGISFMKSIFKIVSNR